MKHRIVVISVDAMVSEDVPELLSMPNCSALFKQCLYVQRMKTVYPSLTHPVHASLITGQPCGKTGIVHNEHFDPFCPAPVWYNKLNEIRCETLFHQAHHAGLKVGVSRWPVTAQGNSCIDYLIPEILDSDLAQGIPMEQALAKSGSAPIMASIVQPNLHLLDNGNVRPGYDAFSAACAADMIRIYQPDLLFTHWGMVDSARHRYGLFGPHISHALEWTDQWIGLLAKAAKDAGVFEQTSFVVLSDHGQLAFSQELRLNSLFREKGLLDVDGNGQVRDYRAYAHSCGMGAQIYLKDASDQELTNDTQRLITEELRSRTGTDFEVLTRQEAEERFGLFGNFSFVVETDGKTSFENEAVGAVMQRLDAGKERELLATHGHMPDKGPQPPLLAAGPAFRCATLEEGNVLEVAPTLAAIMGIGESGKAVREDWLA